MDDVRELGGEAYSIQSIQGRRHPVRRDTETLLAALMMAAMPQTIFELGTGYGLSTLCLALGSEQARIHTVEFDPDIATTAAHYFQEAEIRERITQWICPAEQAVELIPSQIPPPDVVFFDHAMVRYETDLAALLTRCGSKSLLILADNVEDHQEEIPGFLTWMADNAVAWTIHPTQCGLLIARVAG
ncbi:MAG: class I SAM-dependent methyltransferase [Candidatus Tectomicrobia bacterium]|nr:class I SAM-dependent methyltransferase [Candidatus Tectomicrobia bacterium]